LCDIYDDKNRFSGFYVCLLFAILQFPAAVKLAVNVAQTLVSHVGVDLRGHDTAVPQKFLDGAQIRALRQKIGGHGVAQSVRRGKQRHIGANRAVFHHSLN